ncbi:hypothetical protein EV401DRAFT_482494 [Pisolithus croceorrhizus]|nr:hypothetical protein EV401DRAFT_482494 [Pisolithus croceorrhizus]
MVLRFPRGTNHVKTCKAARTILRFPLFAVKDLSRTFSDECRLQDVYISRRTGVGKSKAVFALRATAQSCPSNPLCCHRLFYEETPKMAAIIYSLDVPSSEVAYPVGTGCFPVENSPNNLVDCPSPRIQVCCTSDNWGGRIALDCQPDPTPSD